MRVRSILILSLGLNLVLVAWVLVTLRRLPSSTAALPAGLPLAESSGSFSAGPVPRSDLTETTNKLVGAPPFHWSLLETNDFEAYVANLRGVGCPEFTVRHLLIGEVEARYADLEADAEEAAPFWETPRQERARMSRVHRAQAALEEEKCALLRRLVAVDWSGEAEREWVTDDTACLILGFLSDEKAVRLTDTIKRLERRTEAFKEETDQIVIDTDEPRLEALLTEIMRALESGLSPSESEEAILRGVILVNSFVQRDALIGVPLTGDELRRMTLISSRGKELISVALRADLDGDRHDANDDVEDILKRGSPEADREIRAMLGEKRWIAYERSKDEAFREFAGAARRLYVPLESTVKVYEIRRAAEMAVGELKANPEMLPEKRQAALEAMRRETKQAITATVGARAAQAFFHDDQGWAHEAFGAGKARQ